MNQSSFTSSQDVAKAPPTLDKIPEDVQLAIIKFIQSWKKSEGTGQEREKGKRARDSALRAVALSCRNLLSIYRPELLFDVTLNVRSLMNFYLGLRMNQEAGKLVRSITLTSRDANLTEKERAGIQKDLVEISKEIRAQGIKLIRSDHANIFKGTVQAVFQFLPNIQTLLILQPDFNISFQSKLANARLAPLPFLTHSLKKLYIPTSHDTKSNLKARNVCWILVFCTGLRSAGLDCSLDKNDFRYLAEFSETFSGLSEVRKLSLALDFVPDESTRNYWEMVVGNYWIGGNKKTQAVFNLLKVTKNLQCLELRNLPSIAGGKTSIKSDCLSALKKSFESLENLRLFGIDPHHDGPVEYKADLFRFVKVRVMSVDILMALLLPRTPDVKLPSGLEILCIPYY